MKIPPFDGAVPAEREASLARAAELGVDESELTFHNDHERWLWEEMRAEFEELVARIGPVWIAD